MKKNPNDIHTHKCSCGNAWTHDRTSAGSISEHICNQCGNQVWHRYHGKEQHQDSKPELDVMVAGAIIKLALMMAIVEELESRQ